MTKWLNLWPNEHQFYFSEGIFLFYWSKWGNFCKISFLTGDQGQVVIKWLNLWPNEPSFYFSDGTLQLNRPNGDTFIK